MKKRLCTIGLVLFLVSLSFGCSSKGPQVPSPVATSSPGKLLTVAYLDVGQGDSIFIETPNGKTMLIDAGEATSQRTVSEYIEKKGVAKIDVLIATHPHADHIGAMAYIVDHFAIGSVYMPTVESSSSTYKTLMKAIEKKGIEVNVAKAGVDIPLDRDLTISVLAPLGTGYANVNDFSAVVEITYNQTEFLFMGDASEVSEQQMLKANEDVDSDVLKVGHHGSQTSSSKDFLRAVSPEYAVISVGLHNTYGHPSAAALQRLKDVNARIYRTDQDGTVVMTSNGQTIFIVNPVSWRKEKRPIHIFNFDYLIIQQKVA